MDRLDCQFIMGFYTLAHYTTFIHYESVNPVETLMQKAVHMEGREQLELYNRLLETLKGEGLLPSTYK